jgi:catechol 2,3-dioxygenase-like lactoylglutathione lyase family enzyme
MANPFVHVELHTNDLARAKEFYSKLFTWKLQDMPMPGGGSYTMIDVGEGNYHIDWMMRDRAEHGQRARDVVAIAHVGQPQALERSERLTQREQVGERLAGVVAGREHVEHGDRGVGGQLLDDRVVARAHADGVDVARQDERRVLHGLPTRQLQLIASKQHCVPSKLLDADLKRHPRPRGRARGTRPL